MYLPKLTRTPLGVGVALVAWTSAVADAGVQARLSASSHEHAPRFVKEDVHGSFFVENTGNHAFRIANVKATCSCTTAIKTKGTIGPGEEAEIQYDMHSAAPLRRSVVLYVQTNPPLDTPLQFTATGSWKSVIAFDDSATTLETDFPKPVERRIALRAAPGVEGLAITEAKTRQQDYEVALEPPATGSSALAVLVVRSVDALQPGRHKLGIALSYDWRQPGSQSLTLNVVVHSDFQIAPNPLVVSVTSENPRPTTVLTVRNTKGKPFVINAVTAQRCAILPPALPKASAPRQELPITFDFTGQSVPRRARLLLDLGKENGVLSEEVYFAAERARP